MFWIRGVARGGQGGAVAPWLHSGIETIYIFLSGTKCKNLFLNGKVRISVILAPPPWNISPLSPPRKFPSYATVLDYWGLIWVLKKLILTCAVIFGGICNFDAGLRKPFLVLWTRDALIPIFTSYYWYQYISFRIIYDNKSNTQNLTWYVKSFNMMTVTCISLCSVDYFTPGQDSKCDSSHS